MNKTTSTIINKTIMAFPILIFIFISSFKWFERSLFPIPEIVWRFQQLTIFILIGSILLLFLKKYDWSYKFHWFMILICLTLIFLIPYFSDRLSIRYLDIFSFLIPNDFLPKLNHFLVFPVDNIFLGIFVVLIIFIVTIFLFAKKSLDIIFNIIFILFFLYCCLAAPFEILRAQQALQVEAKNIFALRIFFLVYPIFSAIMFLVVMNQRKIIAKIVLIIIHILGSFFIIFYRNIESMDSFIKYAFYFFERYVLLSNVLYLIVISWIGFLIIRIRTDKKVFKLND